MTPGRRTQGLTLSRSKREQPTTELIEGTRGPIVQAPTTPVSPPRTSTRWLVGGQPRCQTPSSLLDELIGKEPHKGVNPDEVVAIGAPIQAGVPKGEVRDVLLLEVTPLEVTPLALGIETMAGVIRRLSRATPPFRHA